MIDKHDETLKMMHAIMTRLLNIELFFDDAADKVGRAKIEQIDKRENLRERSKHMSKKMLYKIWHYDTDAAVDSESYALWLKTRTCLNKARNLYMLFVAWEIERRYMQGDVNVFLKSETLHPPDPKERLSDNRKKVQFINDQLRMDNLAIRHPESGDPCHLFVVTSRDGLGRIAYSNRVTKKRSGAYRYLAELRPITVIPDAPRREPLVKMREIEPDE